MPVELPFVSISIACYNGEYLLPATLSSLLKQTYPRDRYEIIVVDDGSTDNTPAVVAAFPTVRYVRLEENSGISVARNAGLVIAKGAIFVAFDCDCRADIEWLSNLVNGYRDGKAIGVGSRLIEPQPITRLTTRYISLCDTLFAPVDTVPTGSSRSPLQRLFMYMQLRVQTRKSEALHMREVSELYGATSSFLKEVLVGVGGWDVSMSGIEDRDLSQRLHAAYPDRPFYLVPTATIEHERGESLWQYLKRPVRRGIVNFNFHRRINMMPPIFPFPLLYIAVCVTSLLLSPLVAIANLVVLPQLLYFWWPVKFIQRRQAVLIIFPYIQLLEETMVIVGLTRGLFASIKGRWNHA